MSRTIFVGNLPLDVREREVEDLFAKYGRIEDIDLKLPSRPPGFAFVEFSHSADASDAVRGRDGHDFDGVRLRVELARSNARRGPGAGGGYGGRGGGGFRSERPPPRGGRGGPDFAPRSSGYRVTVTGLPKTASWQDLKDHFRKVGDVTFTQVFRERDGTIGIVDLASKDDMRYAIRKLDDSEFRNPFDRTYIRVREERSGGGGRSRSRSYSRSRSRSKSRGRSYSKSKSRSRSRSKSRSRSPASRSRSRSKSPVRSVSRSRSRSAPRSASPRAASPMDADEAPTAAPADRSRSASPARSASP
ncbi:hypothetical protein WJX73_000672 [Symbiochloris irregularis]|uniref:RRM domain-containing protein n=1 Tax=Symbiochloris irregularis TaxID=706552 RepID=A0AAW1NEG8_9CHLO